MTAGAGGILFADNTATSATVNSGTGSVTIFGASGAAINLTGSSGKPDFLIAGAGNETLNASGSSSSNFFAMSGTVPGSVVMLGGTGNDTMVAGVGPGSATMTGGGGTDVFVFFKQASKGTDVITDFNSNDSVFVEGYATTGSASALQNAATVGASGVTLTLSDGTSVTFSNLTNAASLNGKIQYG